MNGNKRVVRFGMLVSLMLIAAALACNTGTSSSQPAAQAATIVPPTVPPATPESQPDPNSAGGSGGSQAALTIRNDLNEALCYVYLSPSTAGTWGTDWLGDSEVIDVGTQRIFNLDPGQWDIMVTDCDDQELASVYGYNVGGQAVWQPGQSTAGGAPAATGNNDAPVTSGSGETLLELVNYTDTTVCWVYLSPSTADSWGGDWLGDNILEPGQSITFTVTLGTWDLLAEDCNGGELDSQYAVVIDSPKTWTLSGSVGGGDAPLCGNGVCGDFENPGNCPVDCGSGDDPLCGDGFCGDFENGGNCPQDCSDFDFCGDAVCAASERNNVCVADCGYEGGLCGNGVCGDFENSGNCPADCGYAPDCGDGVCGEFESYDTCPLDC
jgi:hypothetical protein